MTAIHGQSMADIGPSLGAKECMRLGARYLRKLHTIPTEKCPFDRTIKTIIPEAKSNILHDLVDVSDFDEERADMTAEQVFRLIEDNKIFEEDLVFTHGDFCLPNMIYDKGIIKGIIDFGRAGISDRYQDIALFLRSFKQNLDECDNKLFLQEYGLITHLDPKKIEFFKTLDEFF